MKCPNKCGELIELKKPALIPPTEDALDILQDSLNREAFKDADKSFYQAIDRICPTCGYYEVRDLTEQEFIQINEKSHESKTQEG